MAKKRGKAKGLKSTKVAKTHSIADVINSEVIAEAMSSTNQPVLIKVCRLCESKDGPFLNIFDAEKVTAKKIDDLMPFVIAENDDLPHKICFRCSAKVEEFFEFVQKCIRAQENLRKAVGKKGNLVTKTKTRKIWEQKLNQSNMSNDDICDALIKKAMEGIKNIPLQAQPPDEEKTKEVVTRKENYKAEESDDGDTPLQKIKINADKSEQNVLINRSRPKRVEPIDNKHESRTKETMPAKESTKKYQNTLPPMPGPSPPVKQVESTKSDSDETSDGNDIKSTPSNNINNFSLEDNKTSVPVDKPKTFNIMDHVSMIKVNGVGILFQCKLCNRNFLKEEVVMTHGCAKNGPKLTALIDLTSTAPPPEPPKVSTVKYINTKTDFLNNKTRNTNTKVASDVTIVDDINTKTDKIDDKKIPQNKPKPKVGPASKIRRNESHPTGNVVVPKESTPPPPPLPSIEFPAAPSLNTRYKLVPGPNNTYTLIEDPNALNVTQSKVTTANNELNDSAAVKLKERNLGLTITKTSKAKNAKQSDDQEVIDSAKQTKTTNQTAEQPYPVGLFQTMPHHSSTYPPQVASKPVSFPTPAMKKQSYTIVQTGNPSKLLISTKTQPVEEPPKKKIKKTRHDSKNETKELKQTIPVEDEVPKDAGFFTFINVDPLLQPSYVLPTHGIIQESQITTSTSIAKPAVEDDKTNDKYHCNMCNEKFSREKKLLTHIQSHYTQMDIEDQQRTEKIYTRKRNKRT